MNSTQLKLETVTPMFLRGSDNESLELRPPAFKALFRYWWRAAVVEMDVENLRERESCLFGNTKKRSPLSVRISGLAALPTGVYAPLPHKPGAFTSQAYLSNGKFNLTLAAPQLSEYEKIAKLGFLLGGVGNRSRRGFGSIRSQDWNSPDVTNLRQEILKTLNDVAGVNQFQIKDHIIKSTLANFPDYPVIWRIYFGHPTNDIDGLLEDIGWATHDHSDRALGGINPRMASPIHIRIQKVGDQFVPIVTQLNSVFSGTPPYNYEQKQQDFINAVIT
jgi:CRISPR-associated protein Cmr1